VKLWHYLLIMLVTGACVTLAMLLARVQFGPRGLRWSFFASVAVLLGLGIYAWSQLSVKETPLITYVLAAIVPTLASVGVVEWAQRRGVRRSLTWLLGTIAFSVSYYPTVFVSYYFLAPLLPSPFG
jgi:hypothetical protein